MGKIRIVLADDHAVLRQGLRYLINAESDMEVVGEAADGTELLAQVAKLRPDVVVLDLSMTPMGGAEATRRLKQSDANCRILVLTVHEDRGYLRELLEAGVIGYMLKRAAADELIEAIRAIARGTAYIDSRIAPKLLSVVSEQKGGRAIADEEAPELTRREFDVLRHIAEGYSNKEIAAMLKLSVKTVETYKARSMEKLSLRSRVDIVRLARDRGWPPVK